MCVTRTIRYRGCPHVHSYVDYVHDHAAYCGNQQVIYDGISAQSDKCPLCAKIQGESEGAQDSKLGFSLESVAGVEPEGAMADGVEQEVSQQLQVEENTKKSSREDLVFLEDHFEMSQVSQEGDNSIRDGKSTRDEEWHMVEEEDISGHDILGIDEGVFVAHSSQLIFGRHDKGISRPQSPPSEMVKRKRAPLVIDGPSATGMTMKGNTVASRFLLVNIAGQLVGDPFTAHMDSLIF